MESGGKMTAEERRQWIKVLLDKVLKIHEQGKHYVKISISNISGTTVVFVHAIKNGYVPGRDYTFSQIIESSDDSIDFGEVLMFYDAAKYLDSLIEGEEESK